MGIRVGSKVTRSGIVGGKVGGKVGNNVGNDVGDNGAGDDIGDVIGDNVGNNVGDNVGAFVCCVVGASVGGAVVPVCDGPGVIPVLSAGVGARVGDDVGDNVGTFVCCVLGTSVGAVVSFDIFMDGPGVAKDSDGEALGGMELPIPPISNAMIFWPTCRKLKIVSPVTVTCPKA